MKSPKKRYPSPIPLWRKKNNIKQVVINLTPKEYNKLLSVLPPGICPQTFFKLSVFQNDFLQIVKDFNARVDETFLYLNTLERYKKISYIAYRENWFLPRKKFSVKKPFFRTYLNLPLEQYTKLLELSIKNNIDIQTFIRQTLRVYADYTKPDVPKNFQQKLKQSVFSVFTPKKRK